MKLIKPAVEILEQSSGIDGLYKHIELCGRTCYKSQNLITKDSAKKFVNNLIKSGHGSVLEHGTVYLKVPDGKRYRDGAFTNFNEVFTDNLYYKMCYNEGTTYITTNYRYIVENYLENWLEYLCEPTKYHEKRVTAKFICDIGISREFNRHRINSVSEQSTRYCNYSKDKFGNELTFIEPCWEMSILEEDIFISHLSDAESHYMALIDAGWKPQQARNVLPLATATELVHTAFVSDWKHFLKLRNSNTAHPQAVELAKLLQEELYKYDFYNN